MVSLLPPSLVAGFAIAATLLADVPVVPKKLEGPMKAKVLAALAGLIILGFALVAFAWWGARYTRRYMDSPLLRRDTPTRTNDDDWAEKPL